MRNLEPGTGVASETNQEMATNQPIDDAAQATFFEKLGAEAETRLEDFFQWLGCCMASRPWIVLFLGECSSLFLFIEVAHNGKITIAH